MDDKEIINILKDNFIPVNYNKDELCYRAAVYLQDGTYLPCVVFKWSKKELIFVLERLKETRLFRITKFNRNMSYKDYVHSFIKTGNKINLRDILKIEISPYAIPKRLYDQIYNSGETAMSWFQFTAKMKDGKEFSFGTSYDLLFFNMPDGYVATDIIEIMLNHYTYEMNLLKQ